MSADSDWTLGALVTRSGVSPERMIGSETVVRWVSSDTRVMRPETLFVCMPSGSMDTHTLLEAAKEAGAVAAVVRDEKGFERAEELGLGAVLVRDSVRREFLGAVSRLAQEVLGWPGRTLRLWGITGTNGKTSSTLFVTQALRALGRDAVYLGTLGIGRPGAIRELNNTTPFPVELAQLMHESVESGATDFCLEVSSHALEEARVGGLPIRVAGFTNLTQDHLDFHGTMEAYAAAKERLFTDVRAVTEGAGLSFRGALNVGDAYGAAWAEGLGANAVRFRVGEGDADLTVVPLSVGVDGMRLQVRWGAESEEVALRVGGEFHAENAATCLAMLLAGGVAFGEACAAIGAIEPVPGRFDPVRNELGIGVIVDYAHTPDALEQLLVSARAVTTGRLITVFGCGGDRDATKRPKMAAVVSRLSDVTVVTSDNPRTEDPEQILRDVLAGVRDGAESVAIIDRREAIEAAVTMAQPGDLVVIAGKGHENYQIIGRTKYPMDDKEMARAALEGRG